MEFAENTNGKRVRGDRSKWEGKYAIDTFVGMFINMQTYLRAQLAFLLTQGTVSIAFNNFDFCI